MTANPGPSIIVRNATILTMCELAPRTFEDVLVSEGKIVAIGPRLQCPAGALEIDGTGGILLPGLVNAHIHLWQAGFRGVAGDWSFQEYFERMLTGIGAQMTPEDLCLANEVGAWEQIESGVTTLLDWSHALGGPEHADAAVDGLERARIRALFGHAPPPDMARWWFDSSLNHPNDAERISRRLQGNALVGFALAIRGPDFTNDQLLANDIAMGRGLGALVSSHIGVSRAIDARLNGVDRLIRAGGLGADINLAHANNLNATEHRQLADAGATVTVAPEIEIQTGMRLPATGAVLNAGALPSLGTDVTAAYSPDMFGQMRLALQIQRFADQQVMAQKGLPHAKPLSARIVLEMATIGGARALRLENQIGTLEPGKRADFILIRPGFGSALTPFGDPFEFVVLQCGVANVECVVVDGHLRKHGGKLCGGPSNHTITALAAATSRMVSKCLPTT